MRNEFFRKLAEKKITSEGGQFSNLLNFYHQCKNALNNIGIFDLSFVTNHLLPILSEIRKLNCEFVFVKPLYYYLLVFVSNSWSLLTLFLSPVNWLYIFAMKYKMSIYNLQIEFWEITDFKIFNVLYSAYIKHIDINFSKFWTCCYLYYGSIKHCVTSSQFIHITLLFLQNFTDDAIIMSICRKALDIPEFLIDVKQFFFSPQSSEENTLHEHFNNVKKVYYQLRNVLNSDVTIKINEIIIGLLKHKIISNLKIKDMIEKINNIKVDRVKSTPHDFIIYTIESLFYFIEKIFEVFKTRDISKFFETHSNVLDLEDKVARCLSAFAAYNEDKLQTLNLDRFTFEAFLNDTISHIADKIKTCSGPDKTYLSIKYQKLLGIRETLIRDRNCASIRERPFSFLLFGDTGVGKSSMINYILRALYSVNKMDFKQDNIISLNANDKYQSEYRSYHSTIILDDIANTRVEMNQESPLQIIIDIVNNQPKYALMPEADMKGKIAFVPRFVVGTTNVKSLQANMYSNNPASILSRFEYIITTRVKSQYRENNSTRLDANKVPLHEKDLWEFDVEYARQGQSQVDVKFLFASHEGQILQNITLPTLLNFLNEKSLEFFSGQAALVQSSINTFEEQLCEHHTYPHWCNICTNMSEQGMSIEKTQYFYHKYMMKMYDILYHMLPMWCKLFIYLNQKNIQVKIDKVLCIIKPIFFVLMTVILLYSKLIGMPYYLMQLLTIIFLILILLLFTKSYVTYHYNHMFKFENTYREKLMDKVNNWKFDLEKYFKINKVMIVIILLLGCIYLLKKFAMKYLLRTCKDQGNNASTLDNTVLDDIKISDEVNIWKPCERVPPVLEVHTITRLELESVVQRNMCYFALHDDEQGRHNTCNGLYITSCMWLVPYHVISRNYKKLEFIYHSSDIVGANHTCAIGENSYIRIGDTDAALLYIPSDCPRKNILRFFSSSYTTSNSSTLIYKNKSGEISISKQPCTMVPFTQKFSDSHGTINYASVPSMYYKCKYNTFKGLCGAVAIGENRFPFIWGMHIAGVVDQPDGISMFLSKDQIDSTLSNFFQRNITALRLVDQGEMKLYFPELNILPVNKPAPKSPINYLTEGQQVYYLGSHSGITRTFHSEVINTLISSAVTKNLGITNNYGKPKGMNTWRPWQTYLNNVSKLTSVNPDILDQAYTDLTQTLKHYISDNKNLLDGVHVISNDVILSGLDGISGFEPINLKASTGWPLCKPKSQVIVKSERIVDGISCPRDAPPEVWDEVSECENKLLRGERINLINRCNLKDEPTKITKDKVRVFAGTPLVGLILLRKYFLSICKLFMDNPLKFECAVGLNCYSYQWTKLNKHMTRFGEDRVIAGDYKSFDSSMSSRITLSAMKYFIHIAKLSGYSADQIKIMEGLATEICFPIYEFNGDYIEVSGSNPSGHSLTVFLNNIANSLYMRYAYYAMNPTLEKDLFFNNVSLVCYGDDNKMSVRRKFDWFNHTTISAMLATCGITYTMADKEAISVPFIHGSQCSFLKRSAVWSEKYECFLPPIEEATLHKILHSHVKSTFLSLEEQSVEAINNVAREYFFYGKEKFEIYRNGINKVIQGCNLQGYFHDGVLNTFDYYENWYVSSYRPSLLDKLNLNNSMTTIQTPNVLKLVAQGQSIDPIGVSGYHNVEFTEFFQHWRLYPIFGGDLYHTFYLGLCPKFYTSLCITHLNDVITCVANFSNNNNVFVTTSGCEQNQTVCFNDGNEQVVNKIDTEYDSTYNLGIYSDLTLSDFFKRPILIKTITWSQLSTLAESFNPWALYFADKRVANRVSNYYLIWGHLHVKFMLNGNPFYYGRLLVDYQPLYAHDTVMDWNPLYSRNLIPASQRLHILLNPTNSKGGEMILPYLLNTNSAIVSTNQITENGAIHIRTMEELQHANGSTNSLTISVFAWMEEIKLSIPTSSNIPGLVAQSDEYVDSTPSTVASNVANVAGQLSRVPTIGSYMRATSLAASAVSKALKAFGMSKPIQLEDSSLRKSVYSSRLAATNCKDISDKLAFDIKNELTIDPSTLGLTGKDEMSIKYLAQIESYLTQFAWLQDRSPNDLLFSTKVRPQLCLEDTSHFYMPPCCWLALPFQYWRGSVIFRFEVVCSDLHRGRLRIVFDPYTVGADIDANVMYTRIIDLADTKDFTMQIGWTTNVPYLETLPITSIASGYSTSTTMVEDITTSLGTLNVYVLNNLTVPSATTSNININVYVKMGDDAEFAVPAESHIRQLHYGYHTPFVAQSGEITDENVNDPINERIFDTIAQKYQYDGVSGLVFMGEKITSIRQVMKRYCIHMAAIAPFYTDGTSNYFGMKLTQSDFPIARGYSPSPLHGTVNRVWLTSINYFAPAFLMYRGALRQKYMCLGMNTNDISVMYGQKSIYTGVVASEFKYTFAENTGSLTTLAENFEIVSSSGFNGLCLTYTEHVPLSEFEIPFYSNYRFRSPRDNFQTSTGEYNPNALCHDLHVIGRTQNTANPFLMRLVSVGEDFMLAGFMGVPPILATSF